jgi:phosphoglycolate phosphatase
MHIIFDLDGTLIDSKSEILNVYRLVFNEIAPSVLPDLGKLNFGLTINDLLHGVYGEDPEKIVKAKQLFVSIYDSSDYEQTNLYEGVLETLQLLESDGNKLYIATNKRLYPTYRILEIKNIKHLFTGVVANEMMPGLTLTKQQMIAALKRKYSFSEGFMVGDSLSDIQAGIDEHLVTIAINYGYESPKVLATKNPTYNTNDFRNLHTFVVNHK